MTRATVRLWLALAVSLAGPSVLDAQSPDRAVPSAKAAAPIDLTGQWVAMVTEDWRYRMVTPPKGDYRGVPVTPEGLAVLNAWDPAADERAGVQCRSYGAGSIMRVAGRLRIGWQGEDSLRIETDAGRQMRMLRFGAAPARAGARTWQGTSLARWNRREDFGSLTVVTTNLRAGYLRKNGVPYGENAVVTEFFDVAPLPEGGALLIVTTIVDDPRYLRQPFVVSSHFKKEADGSRWDPTPCSATW